MQKSMVIEPASVYTFLLVNVNSRHTEASAVLPNFLPISLLRHSVVFSSSEGARSRKAEDMVISFLLRSVRLFSRSGLMKMKGKECGF